MATFTPIYGKRIRVTALDECGNLPAAAAPDSLIVTDGFIAVRMSSEVESANEIIVKKADGSICVNERTDPSFKNFGVEIDFCGVDPGLLSLTTNAEIYEAAAGSADGIVVPEGKINKRFSLELWTGMSGACEPGAETASGYLLLPFVAAGILGNIEVTGEASVNFTMTSAVTRGGNQWGTGPYDVLGTSALPTALPTALDPLDHLLLVPTSVAPPAVAAGLQPMPA